MLRTFGKISWIRLELHNYRQDTIRVCKKILGNTAGKLGMNYELVKNTRKACINPVRILNREFVTALDNSRSFFYKMMYKKPLTPTWALLPKIKNHH